MKKAELFAQYQEAKDTGKEIDSVILYIHMPGGEEEIIINPAVADKMDYIGRTYNDDLVHMGCKDIYIVNAIFTINEGEVCDFGAALDALKDGCRVARAGWNGKGQYIELAENISYQNRRGEIINCEHENIGNKAIAFVGTSGVQMGWLASQADMLADDWIILDEPDIAAEAGESAGQDGHAPTLMPAAL